jgi:drug/metabolite transporter (DMT)-like permease
VCVALVGCIWALIEGWQPVGQREVLLLLGSSLLLASGYQFLMIALRSGAEMSLIGSLRYASVLWAIAIGYVVWDEVPNWLAVAGIVVIVTSGLYILRRERTRGVSHEDSHPAAR